MRTSTILLIFLLAVSTTVNVRLTERLAEHRAVAAIPAAGPDLPAPNRSRECQITRIIDGDTVVLDVQVLPDPELRLIDSARLDGIQAADKPADAKQRATAGLTSIVNQCCQASPQGARATVKVLRRDKYGRLLVRLYGQGPDGPVDLNQRMLELGYAVPWDGQGPKPP